MHAPSRAIEAEVLSRGYRLVAGIDEVGRGPLAGPVVAAAVILPPVIEGDWTGLIRDSKQLTPKQRDRANERLRATATGIGVGAASPGEIDDIGIVAATRLAMTRALDSLDPAPDYLLIDALELPAVPLPQDAIIHGDALSRSIAAASIVAKVARDRLMAGVLDARFPGYGFASNKGYGTEAHMAALESLGPCPAHRRSFAPVRSLLGRSSRAPATARSGAADRS